MDFSFSTPEQLRLPNLVNRARLTMEATRFQPLTTVVLLFVGYILWRGIYNRYFHPLRHFPGPFWASVSDFYKLYFFGSKQAHTLGLEFHAKYGPVVRIAPNLLEVNDPKLLPVIYHREVEKTDGYSVGVLGEVAPPFQTLKHEEHARKRKRIASSFTLTNLRKFEDQVDERIIEWCTTVGHRFADTGEKLDFAAWSQWFAYDAVSELSFGEPIGFVKQARDVQNLIEDFHNMAPMAAIVAALPWLISPILKSPIGKRFFMPHPGQNNGSGRIMKFRDGLLKERLENPKSSQKDDFLDNILAAKNEDGSSITLDEVKAECFVLMVAGSDTTAALFCGFLRYVLETPGVYAKVMAEIDEFDKRGELSSPVAKYTEIKKMTYFNACHTEALRFQPSTPFILPRRVAPGGIYLYGKYVPDSAEIAENPYITNRDKDVYGEDALSFRPERWLEDQEKTKTMDRYLLSWGYGTRICLGKNIAMMSTQKLLLQMLRTFEVSLFDLKNVWRQDNLALLVHHDMYVNVKRREM